MTGATTGYDATDIFVIEGPPPASTDPANPRPRLRKRQ